MRCYICDNLITDKRDYYISKPTKTHEDTLFFCHRCLDNLVVKGGKGLK